MRMRIGGLFLACLIAGCAKEPFEPNPTPVLQSPQPAAMRDTFARTLPNGFTSDDTIIIQAPFHNDLAVLGVLRVDRSKGTFELVALNHMGIKLFDLRGDRKDVSLVFVLPPLVGLKDILLSIAHDIQHMYIDLIPASGAEETIHSKDVKFTQETPDGTVIYKFGGDPSILLEKRLTGFFGTIWRVRYFRYTSESGGLYPRGIVMDNSRYHYRIIVKNRDVEFKP
jgi:hypothetical protein